MRKLIITLLALSLMLCCLSAQAESSPMPFKEIGITLDFGGCAGHLFELYGPVGAGHSHT